VTKVTHVVDDSPNGKAKELAERFKAVLVTPEFISECISQGKVVDAKKFKPSLKKVVSKKRTLEDAESDDSNSAQKKEKLVDLVTKDGKVILQEDEVVYDCLLNQTNIGNNNNKFFELRILKDGGGFVFCSRWGRVGVSLFC
jgi:hypothetical protein